MLMRKDDPRFQADQLFRSEYGKVVAGLVRSYGTAQLENIEDAVQEALLKAMQYWGFTEMPREPTAWLYKVARNQLIDRLRKDQRVGALSDRIIPKPSDYGGMDLSSIDGTIGDSQLRMIFACCHPALSTQHQLILGLKLIGGFSNRELALALLKNEEAVAKAFTRAKRKLKQKIKNLDSPVEIGLRSRLFVVMRVIYLLFSEGYSANSGTQIIKKDICYEAIRLALLLRENRFCRHEQLEALVALMCFHASRFEARQDVWGQLVDLEHQDRSLYNRELIRIGQQHLELAAEMQQQDSQYYLEAAVSYEHCRAATFEDTNWKAILDLYDRQLQFIHSPIASLNRLVPYLMVYGPAKALAEYRLYEQGPDFHPGALSFAILAEIQTGLGRFPEARAALGKAIHSSKNTIERRHFKKKLAALG